MYNNKKKEVWGLPEGLNTPPYTANFTNPANPVGNPNDSSRYGAGLDINGRQGIRFEQGVPNTTDMNVGADGTNPDTNGAVFYFENIAGASTPKFKYWGGTQVVTKTINFS